MSKLPYMIIFASLCFSTVSFATIEEECEKNDAHALYVCREIKLIISKWQEKFAPPQPIVDISPRTLDLRNLTINIPEETRSTFSSSGKTSDSSGEGFLQLWKKPE